MVGREMLCFYLNFPPDESGNTSNNWNLKYISRDLNSKTCHSPVSSKIVLVSFMVDMGHLFALVVKINMFFHANLEWGGNAIAMTSLMLTFSTCSTIKKDDVRPGNGHSFMLRTA